MHHIRPRSDSFGEWVVKGTGFCRLSQGRAIEMGAADEAMHANARSSSPEVFNDKAMPISAAHVSQLSPET